MPPNQCAFEIAENVGLVRSKCLTLIVKSSAQLTEVRCTLYQRLIILECWRNNEKYQFFCSASLHLLHCTSKESEAFYKPSFMPVVNHVWCDLLRISDKSIILSLPLLPAWCCSFPISSRASGNIVWKRETLLFFPFHCKCGYIRHTGRKHIGNFFSFGMKLEKAVHLICCIIMSACCPHLNIYRFMILFWTLLEKVYMLCCFKKNTKKKNPHMQYISAAFNDWHTLF